MVYKMQIFLKEIGKNVIVRRATFDDIDRLCKISKECFQNDIQDQGLLFIARKWWQLRINSAEIEIGVVEIDNQVCAFCIIVLNEHQWKKQIQKKKILKILSILSLCRHLSLCRLFIIKLSRKISSFFAGKEENVSIRTLPRERIRIEPIAVAKRNRKCGLAKLLLRWAENRAFESNRRTIWLTVDKSNYSAQCLYESLGYQLFMTTKYQGFYMKQVEKK